MSLVQARYGSFQIIDSDVTISRSLLLYGEWAQLEIDLIASFIAPGSVVLDAGAFIGTHALAFSSLVGPLGSVIAFEPSKPFAGILKDNASRAPFNNIDVRDCALGAGRGSIAVPPVNLTDMRNFGAFSLGPAGDADGTAAMCPVDALRLERVDVLKADVEGMELEVLRGAEETVARCRPVIFAEGNSLSSSFPILEWSRSHDYVSFGALTPAYNPMNFAGNVENCFGEACEAGLLLLPAERLPQYTEIIQARHLPEIKTLDDLAVLLLHKPQYPSEVLANTEAGKTLGIDYPSPLAFTRRAQLDETSQFLADRAVAITNLTQAVAERDASLVERDSQFQSLAQSLAERAAAIVKLNAELSSLTADVARLGAASAERDAQISKLKELVAEGAAAISVRDAQIAGMTRSVAERDTAIGLWTSQVHTLNESVRDLNKSLAMRDADVAGRDLQVAELIGMLAERDAAIVERDSCIAGILASRSWKTTEPLRRLISSLNGIRSPKRVHHGVDEERLEPAKDPQETEIAAPVGELPAGGEQGNDPAEMEPSEAKPEGGQDLSATANLVRSDFDVRYYLGQYPDVANAGVDPVVHYLEFGAAELRDPSPHFSTKYYLEANPDVKAASINPLLHFVLAGRKEGRAYHPPGGYRSRHLEQLHSLQQTVLNWRGAETSTSSIGLEALAELFEAVFSRKTHGVLSFSHDDYTSIVGGVQLCLLVEQSAFQKQDYVYLHFHPAQPLPVLAEPADADRMLLNIICDGVPAGAARACDIALALAPLSDAVEFSLAVHAIHGHAPESIRKIAAAAQVRKAFFWVHDYFSICPGYNLLRNGISYCGAPPINSPACRICIFGEARPEHFARVLSLFEAVQFTVVSPSESALDIWRTRSGLPHAGTLIHPHCRVEPLETHPAPEPRARRSIRVAFLGYPVIQKGWPVFEALIDRFNGNPAYEFHYLGAAPPADGRVNVTNVTNSGENRSAMVDAIVRDSIDFVVLWSLCPETFSFTTFEAIAGGAHILTCTSAGNIARVVSESASGRIFQNEMDLFGFFESGEAQRYTERRQRPEGPAARLVFNRMTADLVEID